MVSVQFSHSVVSDSLQPHGLQHTSFPILQQFLELTQTHVYKFILIHFNDSSYRLEKYSSFTKHIHPEKTYQFSSVAQSCLTLCDPMDCSTPGLPVHHQLPESTQTHVHGVGDAIQPSHPLSSPSPPAPNPYQHQGLFK